MVENDNITRSMELEKPQKPTLLVVDDIPENIDGILILSGATNPFLTEEYDQISLNGSVERLTESIQLIYKYPKAEVFLLAAQDL